MTRKKPDIALRYALLGSVLFAVSCTTSTISTPSFGPTAALDTVAATNAQSSDALPESTNVVPSASGTNTALLNKTAEATSDAPKQVEALALNSTASSKAPIIANAEKQEAPEDLETGAITAAAPATKPETNAVDSAQKESTLLAETTKAKPEPTGIFALFKKKPSTDAATESGSVTDEAKKPVAAEKTTRITTEAPKPRKPVQKKTVARALPGVKTKNIFGIAQATDKAKKIGQEVTQPVQLASANIGSATRSVSNGIKKQTPSVSVKCFKPELVKMIKRIERHYGKPVIVTSGYRSPKKNRRAGGSKKSLHMYCAAADVQVKGVSKWALAKYIRSIPGRGGVGTYCHTKSVHLDIGSKRDWNWRCRRK